MPNLDVRIGSVTAAFDAFARECVLFDAVVPDPNGPGCVAGYSRPARILRAFAEWMSQARHVEPDRLDLVIAESRLLSLVSRVRWLDDRPRDPKTPEGFERARVWVPAMLRDDGAGVALTIDPDAGLPGHTIESLPSGSEERCQIGASVVATVVKQIESKSGLVRRYKIELPLHDAMHAGHNGRIDGLPRLGESHHSGVYIASSMSWEEVGDHETHRVVVFTPRTQTSETA